MNNKTNGNRGPQRAGALALAAAIGVLATACGVVHFGSASAPSPASTPDYAQELSLAQCIRSHGVPNFPDPNASGYSLTATGSIEGAGGASIALDGSQVQAAYGDCRHLVPGGPSISQLEQAVQQGQQRQAQALPELLKWEQCVRSHGEPTFSLGLGGQSPAPSKSSAFNPNTPQFQAALSACQHLLPAGASIHVSTNRS
jgi:hypothetical protein